MTKKIHQLLLIGIITVTCNYSMGQAIDFSNISDEQRRELEEIIYDYLARSDTRDKLVKTGLISPLNVLWKEGLQISSVDGNFKLKIGGRIMNDWGWLKQESSTEEFIGDQVDGTILRRARICIRGDIYKNVEFKADYDFADGDPEFKDVYISVKDIPYVGSFYAGHFKEPYSLEEMMSSNHMTFMERGLNNVFTPSRNTGFALMNRILDNRMTCAAGVFRNADDFGNSEGDSSTEGGYSLSSRITGLPYYKDDGRRLIHTAFSYSHQNAFEESVRFRARPTVRLADNFVDTGSFSAEHFNLYNPEFAVVYGPFSIQSEYTFANIGADDIAINGGDDPRFSAWYVSGSYFLTGEHRTYDKREGFFVRIKPYENFDLKGGWGALQLIARYSEIDLNDEGIKGGRLQDITLGFNWYLNPNTIIRVNYVHADAAISETDDASADILGIRFHIDF